MIPGSGVLGRSTTLSTSLPIDYVRDGDTVVVWKLGRLGRNTLHILETVKALTDRGVTVISVTDGIDSSTAAGRMMVGAWGHSPSTSANC